MRLTKLLGTRVLLWGCILGLVLVGCGDKKPAKDGRDWSLNLKETGGGEGPADDDDDDDDDDDGGGKKPEAAVKPKKKPVSSGRPSILMGPSRNINSTFGVTPGAVLKLIADQGKIILKIREFSLDAGYNIEFSIAGGAGQTKGAALGSVARLRVSRGTKLKPARVVSQDAPFEVRLPLGGRDTLNLAVGSMSGDSAGNEAGAVTWKIVAPDRVEKGFGEAYFKLKAIGPIMYLHGTAAAPSDG